MNEQPVIRTRGLTRYFGARPAVYELNLEVPRGGVFALLGRNGSGKTTTIRMLLGLLAPTRGEGTILGYDIRALPPEARARIGYLTEEHQLYGWMTVRECGEFQSRFYPTWNDKVFRGIIGHFGLRPTALREEPVPRRARGPVPGADAGARAGTAHPGRPRRGPRPGRAPVAGRVHDLSDAPLRPDHLLLVAPTARRRAGGGHIAVLDRSVCAPFVRWRHSATACARFGSASPAPRRPCRKFPACSRPSGRRANCASPASTTTGPPKPPCAASRRPRWSRCALSLEDAFISYLGDRGEKSFILSETEA